MTTREQIILQELINNGYNPSHLVFKNNLKHRNYGWFVTMADETVYYLGQRIDSALYNIVNRKIKPSNDGQ